jgi:hypothetical protein
MKPAKDLTGPSTSESAFSIANNVLFGLAITLLGYDFVSTIVHHELIQGFKVDPTFADIPLILALGVVFTSNFDFYRRIVSPAEETPMSSLFSLFGMLLMMSLPIVLFWTAVLEYRYLFLTAYGFVVVLKNWQLQRRFQKSELGRLFALWKIRALLQTFAGLIGGACFYVLMDPRRQEWFFSRLIVGKPIVFTPNYPVYVTAFFNGAFCVMCIWLFRVGGAELNKVNLETATNCATKTEP